MKCPQCGYNSFDHMDSCKKCGNDLTSHKGKFGLRSLFFARDKNLAKESISIADQPTDTESTVGDEISLDSDFMSKPEAASDSEDLPLDDLLTGGDEQDETALSVGGATQLEPSLSDEASAFNEEEGEELDLDMDWQDDQTVFDSGETVANSDEPTPDLDDWTFENTEGDEKAKESRMSMEQEEPKSPFDLGGSGTLPASPEGLTPSAEKQEPSSEDKDVSTDIASLFLDSLEQKPGASGPATKEELRFDPFPALATGTEPTSDEPSPVPCEGENAEEGPASAPYPDDAEVEEVDTAKTAQSGVKTSVRFAASMIDLLVLLILFALFVGAGKLALVQGEKTVAWPTIGMLADLAIPYFLLFFSLTFGYFTLFHFLTGQTPGKMIFGLRVETVEGSDLTLSQAFLRSIGGLLSALPMGAGYLRILFDPQQRGWNDRLAGSRVTPTYSRIDKVDR